MAKYTQNTTPNRLGLGSLNSSTTLSIPNLSIAGFRQAANPLTLGSGRYSPLNISKNSIPNLSITSNKTLLSSNNIQVGTPSFLASNNTSTSNASNNNHKANDRYLINQKEDSHIFSLSFTNSNSNRFSTISVSSFAAQSYSIDSRFVASPHMVSDKQNKIDYSLSIFSEKILEAAQLVSKNKETPNKKERSPFSGKYVTTRGINHELKQAKLAIDKIPNNNLSKTIAKDYLINLIDEAGKKLLQNNNDLGYILTTSAKKFNAADHISNLFEFVNYVSNDKMDKANEKLTDTAGTLAGAYAGAKIGARGGSLFSLVSGTILGGFAGTKEGRELLTSIVAPSKHQFKSGEFDNLSSYAIQAEKIKQEMSMFNDKIEKNADINPPSVIFDYPNIIQDGTK